MNDNRHKENSDYLILIMKGLAIGSWLLFVIGLIISFYAAPEDNYGLLRYHNIAIRTVWLTPLTGYLYIILWLSALLSYLSIIINHFRSRRKNDNKHYNLVLLFIIAIGWIAYIIKDIG